MTEEKLSKNELKRRLKAEKKAAEKADKVKAQAEKTTAPKKASAALDEDISPNEYFKIRSSAIEDLKSRPETHPYPHKFNVTLSLHDFIEKYGGMNDGTIQEEVTTSVAGRIHAIRESGAKLIFYDLRGEGKKIQVRFYRQRRIVEIYE